MNNPLDRLKYHVTGAIERGEAKAIKCVPAFETMIQPIELLESKLEEYAGHLKSRPEFQSYITRQSLETHMQGPHVVTAEFVLQCHTEIEDYIEHCKENEIPPYLFLKGEDVGHIMAVAATYLYESGHDVEGWR